MRNYFRICVLGTFFLFIFASFSFAQNLNFPEPREEKLLNDLKLLIWSDRKSDQVSVKIRIHSGSAFDPKDKMGTMALLGDILFPDDEIKNFFKEELGGDLKVTTTYDYIQIDATAKADKFLTVLETLAPVVSNPLINKELTKKVKAKRLELIKELEKEPSYMADKAIAQKLLGDYPYGRPIHGTAESLAKIDFADIIFAKQRFLSADNATITISGKVKSAFAYRATRRLFGGWSKSDQKTPATFRLPTESEKTLSLKTTDKDKVSELRFAFEGIARNDKDFYSAKILTEVLQRRMNSSSKDSVKINANLLPSYVVFRFSNWNVDSVKMVGNMIPLPVNIDNQVKRLLDSPIKEAEFNVAKTIVEQGFGRKGVTEHWLDVDTFRLKSLKNEIKSLKNVSLSNVQKIANKWKQEDLTKILYVTKVEESEEDVRD